MDFIIIVKPRGQIPDIPLGKKRSLKAKHMLCQTASCDEGELQLQLRKNRLLDPCKEDLESVGEAYDSQDLRNPESRLFQEDMIHEHLGHHRKGKSGQDQQKTG